MESGPPAPHYMASYKWCGKASLHVLGTNEQTAAAKDQWVLVYEIRKMIMFQACGMVVGIVWYDFGVNA